MHAHMQTRITRTCARTHTQATHATRAPALLKKASVARGREGKVCHFKKRREENRKQQQGNARGVVRVHRTLNPTWRDSQGGHEFINEQVAHAPHARNVHKGSPRRRRRLARALGEKRTKRNPFATSNKRGRGEAEGSRTGDSEQGQERHWRSCGEDRRLRSEVEAGRDVEAEGNQEKMEDSGGKERRLIVPVA